jgi:putative ABC transport system permease protein
MLSPRWRKVLGDLWSNKTRTILVVMSIAVGVFAVGMIGGARVMLAHDLAAANDASNPASAKLHTEPFDDDLVQAIRRLPGVDDVEGRSTMVFQVGAGRGVWKNTMVKVIPDFNDLRINKIRPISGAWPPPQRELLLERSSLAYLNTQVGSTVLVDLPDGTKRAMRVAGAVYDVSWASQLSRLGAAYITSDTAHWLGQSGQFTELHITVTGDRHDIAHIKQVVAQVRDKIEKSGRSVVVDIPDPPGQHWADSVLVTIMLVMSVLGVISLLMSGFLVVNTIGALLAQQTRQIGVMKSIGARSRDIVGMYLMTVFIFGVLALLAAIPLGALGAQLFVNIFAGLLNFDSLGGGIPPYVLGLEVAAGLLAPLLAALWPVLSGTRITVREAISGHGLGKGRYGTSGIDRIMGRIRFLSRPLLLSLRNTFRRRGRLALTLSTLMLGGAMVIGVLSVRGSLLKTLDDYFFTYNYDIDLLLARPARITAIENLAHQVSGVVAIENWGETRGRRILADGAKTPDITMTGLPTQTQLFQPKIVAGRWLRPKDQNAVVIAADLLKTEPDLTIGDDLVLEIDGHESAWRIVGIAQVLSADRQVYADYDYLAQVTNSVGRSSELVVVTKQHDAAFQAQVAKDLRERLKQAGLQVVGTLTISDLRQSVEFNFNIIVIMLLVMAVLLAVVGGLGLMGTMSINVLERTREIGVMRAIGASNGAILWIVLVEGMMIGVVSWLIAFALALPFSMLLSRVVGQTLAGEPLSYTFSLSGALLWLGIVVVLAAIASFLPAWNASRVTVRDVLAYE